MFSLLLLCNDLVSCQCYCMFSPLQMEDLRLAHVQSGDSVWLSYSVTVSLYVCVRPFSHHGNLVSHNNSVIRSKNINAHTHRWNKCPASCSFLGVCYWKTKTCFIWRKVETEKELCVSDTSYWSHCQA